MKKYIKLFLLFTFANLCAVMHSMQNKITELSQLHTVLNSLASISKPNPVSIVGLVGESLINKRFSEIFVSEQLTKIAPEIKRESRVLVAYDRDKNIYQLTALPQGNLDTCDVQAFKNCLWMIYALNGDFNQFKESYLKILDPAVFDKYFNSTGCKLVAGQGSVSFATQVKDIRSGKIACTKGNECLPQNSLPYLNLLFSFSYARHPASVEGKRWMELRTFAEGRIREVEYKKGGVSCSSADSSCYESANSMAMLDSFLDRDVLSFYKVIMQNDACFAIEVGIDVLPLAHTTCLIVHKVNNNIEYLFLDSYENRAFNNPSYQYYPSPLIDAVKFFVENPENFKKTLIRRAYVYLKKNVQQDGLNAFKANLNVFQDDEFKDLELMKNELYEAYKPHFCNLIKEYIKKDSPNQAGYEKMLVKMDCAT